MSLEVLDLKKSFGDKTVLDAVNLTARPGEALIITGANGAGKSTLIQCLAYALEWDSGAYRISGRDFNSRTDIAKVSVMLADENSFLPRFTIEENLYHFASLRGIAGDAAKEGVEALRTLLKLQDIYRLRPGTCSRGSQQMFFIARCLMDFNADVYLMDEPFTHLDRERYDLLSRLFSSLLREKQKTLILTAQEIQLPLIGAFDFKVMKLGALP